MSDASILGLFAHPDDEVLASGGVLARHAAAGARTAVVTATWGPNSHRAQELADALRILGAAEPRMLGYADHHIPASAPGQPRWCDVPLEEAIEQAVAHIRAWKPDIMLGHDAYGSSGHPDHVRAHRIALLAAHAAGLDDLYPEAGPAWQPRALYVAVYPRTGAAGLAQLVAGVGKRLHLVPDELVTAAVDVRPWVATKWEAIKAHASEAARPRSLPGMLAGLDDEERSRLLSTEWYVRYNLGPADSKQHELTA